MEKQIISGDYNARLRGPPKADSMDASVNGKFP